MKELSIEKKAKRYDKAIERAEGLIDFCSDSELKTLEYVFPELAMSKDEKIRKELIEFVKSRGGFKQEWIVWIEKQCKQNIEWSEDDERMLHTIIADFKGFIRNNTSTLESHFNECIGWLKSLKCRVQSKQECNEEEMSNKVFIKNCL